MTLANSNVLVRYRRRCSLATLASFAALSVAACASEPSDAGSDGSGGTNASGTGGSAAGSPATGGVAPQGGGAGTEPSGGVGAPASGGVGPSGGSSGASSTGGAAGVGISGAGGAQGANGGAGSGGSAGASGGASGAAGAPQGGRGGAGGGGAGQGGKGGTAGSGTGGAGGRPNHTGTNGALKIMPLGDSITASFCWRPKLWQKLRQAGKTAFDFVGSQTSSDCGVTGYDANNEGHGGYLVTTLTTGMIAELRGWIQTNTPDLVLLHFGTNDCWNSVAPGNVLTAYGVVVDELRAKNPNVWVLVAQIIAMNPINTASCTTCQCTACGGRVQTLNGMIPAWAASKSTAASPVLVVDQWTGFNATTDTDDGVHPNDAGSEKMATKWFNALNGLI